MSGMHDNLTAVGGPPVSHQMTEIDSRMGMDSMLLRPLVFTQPIRLAARSSWAAHVPFAFWIVDALKPSLLVELGAHSGTSYSAFAQAIRKLELATACYAVDIGQRDPQTGFDGETVFEEWSAFHDRHFAGFSRLVRSTFDQARPAFADGSVDLLHINRLHAGDDIRHHFESWLPKLSDRAVVLLHDINDRQGDLGRGYFWEEVTQRFPTFAFPHGRGLGIVAVGAAPPADVRWLVRDLPQQRHEIRVVQQFFAGLGEGIEREGHLKAQVTYQRELRNRVSELEALARRRRGERDELAAALREQRHERRRHKSSTGASRHSTTVPQEVVGDTREAAAAKVDDNASSRYKPVADVTDPDARWILERNRLHAVIADLEQERASTDATSARLRVAAAKAVQERKVVGRALTMVSRDLREVLASPVWRLTAPLRRLSRLGLGSLLRARGIRPTLSVVRAAMSPRRLMDIRRVAMSGLFDEQHYLSRYDDVRRSGVPAVVHYVVAGAREGRSPHPLFDGAFYLEGNPDVRRQGANPLLHFVRTGSTERRDPHPLFWIGYFLEQHPELLARPENPLRHYLSVDPKDARSPHPLFDPTFYIEHTPEAAAGHLHPLVHFLKEGGLQGRAPHPLFDAAFYMRQNADVRSSGHNPLLHYLEHVPGEDRDPHPLFDSSFYLDQAPDLVERHVNPLAHFVEHGWREGRRPNPAFDPRWYLEMNPEVAESGENPLTHFVRIGWREHRDPSPEFSTADYLAAHPDIAANDTNPLHHYLVHGLREGRAAQKSRAASRRLPPPPNVRLHVDGTANAQASWATPTIVCLSHVVPWPPRAGNEYRVLRMLDWLVSQQHRVLLVLAPLPTESVSDKQLGALATRIGNVVLCRRDGVVKYNLSSCPDLFEGLDGGRTRNYAIRLDESPNQAPRDLELLRIERTYCHDVAIEVALRAIDGLEQVVLLGEYLWMTRLFPLVDARVPTVVDTHDMYSTKAEKVVSFGVTEATLSRREEATRLNRADLVLAIQERERTLMQELVPSTDVITVGVDFDAPLSTPDPNPGCVLIVGSGNEINRLGIQDFLHFAWPRILASVPDATLLVAGPVGRHVPEDSPRIEILGVVEDLAPLYARARVVVNPAAAGTGLKVKTLEALNHARPVVAWPNGFDGIPEALRPAMALPGDWFEFAEQVIAHLKADLSVLDPSTHEAVKVFVSPSTVYANLSDRLTQFFASMARSS